MRGGPRLVPVMGQACPCSRRRRRGEYPCRCKALARRRRGQLVFASGDGDTGRRLPKRVVGAGLPGSLRIAELTNALQSVRHRRAGDHPTPGGEPAGRRIIALLVKMPPIRAAFSLFPHQAPMRNLTFNFRRRSDSGRMSSPAARLPTAWSTSMGKPREIQVSMPRQS